MPATASDAPGLAFRGGWLGHISYEATASLQRLPLHARRDLAVPLASWALHPVWFRVLPRQGRLELWSRGEEPAAWPGSAGRTVPSLGVWSDLAEAALADDRMHPLLAPLARLGPDTLDGLFEGAMRSFSRDGFEAAVRGAQAAVREGEVFQANLAHRVTVPTRADPFAVYVQLRRLNPSPFAGYLEEDWGAIVSNSPERLVDVRDLDDVRVVRARPIAGTRPRASEPDRDAQAVADLRASSKERAEHTMLVDLARNDLGRLCAPGSVGVREFQVVERYSHVHHLVSEVTGTLRAGVAIGDILRATFPGGTITGAPKLRAIEVIDRLEPVARGPYTGSLGYVNDDGTSDLNILIRTLVFESGRAHAYAGAGIVADSVPAVEYEETLHKAAAMLTALGMVEGRGRAVAVEVPR